MIVFESGNEIKSSEFDANFNEILALLNSHLDSLDEIATKLDTIEVGAGTPITGNQIISQLNASYLRLDENNCPSDISNSADFVNAINAHRTAVYGHAINYVGGPAVAYTYAPGGFTTAAERNLMYEVYNMRYAIHKLLGQSTWADTPVSSIETLNSRIGSLAPTVLRRGVRTIGPGDVSLSINSNDYLFVANTSSAVTKVYLPTITSAMNGREIAFKCDSTQENNLGIYPASGQQIDDDTVLTHDDVFMDNYWSVKLIARYDIGQWRSIR
ncbi:hypothetical protein [Bacteroides sp.]|uniref:hypothetical protein n=1 Tax=Bacteroides sp. TaxID=29523 RepID=UPI002627FACB|nr:hypothetical protein [Bacteroides sp.]MDD3039588.1 hypothetical protein [Bacteroides sp.]